MTKIDIRKDEPIDRALRKFKNRLKIEGAFDEMRRREYYEKPSERKRRQMEEARRRTRRKRRRDEDF